MGKNYRLRFSEHTRAKLTLLHGYLRSWVPVFLHGYHSTIAVVDAFAGPGEDKSGHAGSPVIIRTVLSEHVKRMEQYGVNAIITLNDKNPNHVQSLRERFSDSSIVEYRITNDEASRTIRDALRTARQRSVPTFIFADQFGFSEIDRDLFLDFCETPKTDLLLFLATEHARRFADSFNFLSSMGIDFPELRKAESVPEAHRAMMRDYQKVALSAGHKDVLFGSFALQGKRNRYGLMYMSHDLRGADAFVRQAWKLDPVSGNGQLSLGQEPLFDVPTDGHDEFKEKLRARLSDFGNVTNEEVFRIALEAGLIPNKHARPYVDQLVNSGAARIEPSGNRLYYSLTSIKNKPTGKLVRNDA